MKGHLSPEQLLAAVVFENLQRMRRVWLNLLQMMMFDHPEFQQHSRYVKWPLAQMIPGDLLPEPC